MTQSSLTMERQIIEFMSVGCFIEHQLEFILALDVRNMVFLRVRPGLGRREKRVYS